MSNAKSAPRWYEGLGALHWTVLAVASAGWVFDVYEVQLFTIFKTPMLAELTDGSPAAIELHGNLGFAAFLVGGAAGGLLFGVLGDRFGRVRIMAVTILVYALWLLPVMAFFVLEMRAGYAIYFPELFPTRLRATGSSACFNLGRVLGAAILIVRGTLGSALGLRGAVVAMSGLFWIGLIILIFAPETRGSDLPE